MNNLDLTALVNTLGWTLLHFVWQGMLVWLIAALALHLLKRRSAELRYSVATAYICGKCRD